MLENNNEVLKDKDVDLLNDLNLDLFLTNPHEIKMEILNENVGFITDVGIQKEENQDFAVIGQRMDGLKIMIVADGVTSSKYSAESAQFSCEYLFSLLNKKNSFNRDYVVQSIRQLNTEIIKKQKLKKIKNSYLSTIILALIKDNEIILAWLGDSRAYFINNESGILLTKDDSYINVLIDSGKITQENAKDHPKKHVITQCIGLEDDKKKGFSLKINTKTFKLPDNYNLLLCTDGLWGIVDLSKGINFRKNIDSSLMKMIKEANKAGGNDNITCALYQPETKRGIYE